MFRPKTSDTDVLRQQSRVALEVASTVSKHAVVDRLQVGDQSMEVSNNSDDTANVALCTVSKVAGRTPQPDMGVPLWRIGVGGGGGGNSGGGGGGS